MYLDWYGSKVYNYIYYIVWLEVKYRIIFIILWSEFLYNKKLEYIPIKTHRSWLYVQNNEDNVNNAPNNGKITVQMYQLIRWTKYWNVRPSQANNNHSECYWLEFDLFGQQNDTSCCLLLNL